MILDDIISVLREAKSVVILPHVSADGDALGSSLALALALEKLDKKATIYLEEDIPDIYAFLPGRPLSGVFHESEAFSGSSAEDIWSGCVVTALDTGDIGRLGTRAGIFEKAEVTVNIDHHATNTCFARHNYIHKGSSAVGEIVYQMIKMMGLDIDPDMAVCLYVAIATDTGGFRYSNTTSITHQIVADLISTGIDIAEISQKVFDTVSLQKVRLMGMVIGSLEFFENGTISVVTVSRKMMEDSGARDEDCDGIVNIGRSIKGVEVAVMLREAGNGEIRVNLRSNRDTDVSVVANLYSGGGHKKAAGCTIKGNLQEVKQKIVEDLIKQGDFIT